MNYHGRQILADMDEETALIRYLTEQRSPASDIEPFFTVTRPSSRGGAEQQNGGRSLLLAVIVDGLVIAWLLGEELVARLRRRSPRGMGKQ